MKVSIIIPVYNAEQFIKDCLSSVSAQTLTNGVECILVDDCSMDDSMQMANRFITEDKSGVQFKILHQEQNQGPSAARNKGIREATGEYIFFLDADDTIAPCCIESLYKLAKKYDADYVQGVYDDNVNYNERSASPLSCSGKRHPLGMSSGSAKNEKGYESSKVITDRKEVKRLLLDYKRVPFTPHNRLVRRQMIIDHHIFFDERIRVREDFLWMTFVAKHVNCCAECSQPTYHRGYNEASLTHSIDKEREILGYRVLIEEMVANYDPFLLGRQKELALEALIMALQAEYYHDELERRHLTETIASKNSYIENALLAIYLRTQNSKVLHLLIRIYKWRDQ